MRFSTALFCGIDFNRKTYHHLDKVQEDIAECKHGIEQSLHSAHGAGPHDQ